MDRWRQPITIHAVEHDSDTAMRLTEEGWYEGVSWTTDEAGYNRLRDGQVCLMCMEPQAPPAPNPVPVRCSLCGYEMRANQRRDFIEQFGGDNEFLGPSTTLEDELAMLDEKADRWKHVPGSKIVVPRGVS